MKTADSTPLCLIYHTNHRLFRNQIYSASNSSNRNKAVHLFSLNFSRLTWRYATVDENGQLICQLGPLSVSLRSKLENTNKTKLLQILTIIVTHLVCWGRFWKLSSHTLGKNLLVLSQKRQRFDNHTDMRLDLGMSIASQLSSFSTIKTSNLPFSFPWGNGDAAARSNFCKLAASQLTNIAAVLRQVCFPQVWNLFTRRRFHGNCINRFY